MKRRIATTAAVALLGVGVLAGCSSSSEPAADETTSQTDGGNQMLPPVIVEEGQTSVSAPVGKDIVINVPAEDIAGTTVASSDTAIVEVFQFVDLVAGQGAGGRCFGPLGGQSDIGAGIVVDFQFVEARFRGAAGVDGEADGGGGDGGE